MKSITEDLVHVSVDLMKFEQQSESARLIRDGLIYLAFVKGERQADIAMYAGLSESTVKHIIAAQKEGVK